MPFPAARHAVSDVGAPGDQRPGALPCPHSQVGGLFRCGQPRLRQVRSCSVRQVRRRHLRGIPQEAAAAPDTRQAHGGRPGQRAVPHHAVLLAPLRRRYRKVLTLLFLPPYSPQLAPIERVWKLTRRLATHNRYFATLAEVLVAVEACFERWRNPNSVLRRLCGII